MYYKPCAVLTFTANKFTLVANMQLFTATDDSTPASRFIMKTSAETPVFLLNLSRNRPMSETLILPTYNPRKKSDSKGLSLATASVLGRLLLVLFQFLRESVGTRSGINTK